MEAEQVLKMLETVLDAKLKPLQEDMTGIKQEMAGMKQDLSNIKQDISGLHHKFDLLASEQPDDTIAMLQIINTKLDHIQKDVAFIYFKTSQNELEINRLKAQ